jgi:ABC-type nitrate/sulfonate/bicarbonate transport system substrate-binding protein
MPRPGLKLLAAAVLAGQMLAAGAAAKPVRLRVATVGVPPSLHTLYLHVAFEEGIYRKNGLIVDELIQLAAGPLVTQALVAGRIDVGETDAEGVINAVASGAGNVLAISAPAQHLSYLIAAQREIRSLKDLAGQPFAISRPGALSHYLLFPALEREGMARNSLTWTPIGGASERRLALVNNRVKGALLHVDFALAAERDAQIVILDRVARSSPDYPHELLVVRRDLAEKQPEVVTAIARSIIEACRFMAANRARTIEIYQKYTNEKDVKLANEAYDAIMDLKGLGVNGGMTRKGLEAALQLALENGALKRPLAIESFADFRFQEEALRQIGTIPE